MTTPDYADQIDTSLYLNRWIAVVRGRVIGVGESEAKARRAALNIRGKDKPHLLFVDEAGNIIEPVEHNEMDTSVENWFKDHPLLQNVVQILKDQQLEAYLVGGAVRDLLMGRPDIYDLDFAVPQDGLRVARRVANQLDAAYYALDAERGTGRAVVETQGEKTFLDFATFRGDDLEMDLADRDFTINAIALRVSTSELIDPTQGERDLQEKRIRMVSDNAIKNDPLRMLRAVRQATAFGFEIEPKTAEIIQATAHLLGEASVERQRDELMKLLNTPTPGGAIQQLRQLGILPHILPEVEQMIGVEQSAPHHLDVFDHTALALNEWGQFRQKHQAKIAASLIEQVNDYFEHSLTGDVTFHHLMPLALLFHDTGKPSTRTTEESETGVRYRFFGHEKESAKIVRQAMEKFRFSSQAISFVENVVAHHMRPLGLVSANSVSRRAIYRFFRDTNVRGMDAGITVAIHALIDHQATYAPETGTEEEVALLGLINRLLEAYFEQRDQTVDPPLLLTGQDLIKVLDLGEGKLIGILLKRLKEAQATGEVTDREEAIAFIKADPDFIAGKEY